ncbi:hypothetical protein VTJ04DRAFT_1482 [Mycothermus thermophilus]|uniref:uncharacterized protein n=1 Tax=Humicola insolens TaxID=85995 RepID=UPI0037433610
MLGSKVKSAWLGTSTPLPGPHPVRLPGAPGTGTSELPAPNRTTLAASWHPFLLLHSTHISRPLLSSLHRVDSSERPSHQPRWHHNLSHQPQTRLD